MERLQIHGPIIQVAIDVLTIDAALKVAEAAVRAGVDWLEAGTPLITFEGVRAIGALARAFPGVPVLADYKMMDGVRKYVVEAANQGARLATICAVASDASLREAIAAANETGVTLIADLYNSTDIVGRAVELKEMGIHGAYLHWGADQRNREPDRDALRDLHGLVGHAHIPVGAASWSAADGERAMREGADFVVIGAPLIQSDNVERDLREYCARARDAWHTRHQSVVR